MACFWKELRERERRRAREPKEPGPVATLRRPISSRAMTTRTKKTCLQDLGAVSFVRPLRMARSQSASATWMAKSAATLDRLKELRLSLSEIRGRGSGSAVQKANFWRRGVAWKCQCDVEHVPKRKPLTEPSPSKSEKEDYERLRGAEKKEDLEEGGGAFTALGNCGELGWSGGATVEKVARWFLAKRMARGRSFPDRRRAGCCRTFRDDRGR